MKRFLITIPILFLLISCGTSPKNKVEGVDAQSVAVGAGDSLTVDVVSSVINWKGTKPLGAHNGTISLKEGNLIIKGDSLVAGKFIIDMNTIKCLDLEDPETSQKLVGHLESADFFDVEKYPEATFTITGSELITGNDSVNYIISGNLKMKDTERNISFGAKISKDGDLYKAETVPFTIDRTQWGITYKSASILAGLKDGAINDNIELQISISAKE